MHIRTIAYTHLCDVNICKYACTMMFTSVAPIFCKWNVIKTTSSSSLPSARSN